MIPILISKPIIDFDKLLFFTKEALGRNIASKLDSSGKNVKTISSYIKLLEEINSEYDKEHIYDFINYTFLIMLEEIEYIRFVEREKIFIITQKTKKSNIHLLICSGSLSMWKEFVIKRSKGFDDLHALANDIQNILEKEELYLWDEYSKIKETEWNYYTLMKNGN